MSDKQTPPPSPTSSGPASEAADPLFFDTVNRSNLAINKAAAGAGVLGLLGFAGLFAIAAVFFVTESYFISMLMVSFALLVYVTGAELITLFLSSVTVFFSSKHVIDRAAYLQETLVPLRRFLQIRPDTTGTVTLGPLQPGAILNLPDNPLSRDIATVLDGQEQPADYLQYIAHAYYAECHELYDYSSAHLEFVAQAMPLFGLIGTIVGLIGMFDSLSADVTVEFVSPQLALALKTTLYGAVFSSVYKIIASRFDQRLKALDYDFETFCRALEVLVETKTKVRVGS
ncbi:MAG: MotA/TolQ/ExbB proton channel family protein [Myxococcota bacterium]